MAVRRQQEVRVTTGITNCLAGNNNRLKDWAVRVTTGITGCEAATG